MSNKVQKKIRKELRKGIEKNVDEQVKRFVVEHLDAIRPKPFFMPKWLWWKIVYRVVDKKRLEASLNRRLDVRV